jgi:hypothetical protein
VLLDTQKSTGSFNARTESDGIANTVANDKEMHGGNK